jgi:hypothetical protein
VRSFAVAKEPKGRKPYEVVTGADNAEHLTVLKLRLWSTLVYILTVCPEVFSMLFLGRVVMSTY